MTALITPAQKQVGEEIRSFSLFAFWPHCVEKQNPKAVIERGKDLGFTRRGTPAQNLYDQHFNSSQVSLDFFTDLTLHYTEQTWRTRECNPQ